VRWLLDGFARLATRVPALTLLVLLGLTVAFGAAASTLEVDTGLEGFAPADGAAATLDAIEDRFTTSTSVQVLVDDGPAGNVVEQATLADALDLGDVLAEDPAIAPVLASTGVDEDAVVTFALPLEGAAEATDDELGELDDATFDSLAASVLDDGGDGATELFSDDLRTDPPRARSGLIVVDLDATAPSEDRAEAARAVQRVVDDHPVGDARRSVLSNVAVEDGAEAALERDTPILLSVSLLLVVLVLALLFRSVTDVLVGFLGLMVTIVWTIGVIAILGPGNLGLTGAFNQVSIAVPVLLVGLGIDYSVHLTTRYREQRRLGDAAVRAARVALGTVGVALVLATAASVAGFLANFVTPVPPIRDFGIFAAVGIVAAFVVLGAAVPATRVLVDRRRDARTAGSGSAPAVADVSDAGAATQVSPAPEAGPAPAVPTEQEPPAADGRDDDERTGTTMPRWARLLTALATRRPGRSLAATVVALALGAWAASGLSTEFDERDFLPEGEPVLTTIDRLDEQFGGGVGERTFVLVDGDVRDPDLLAAVAELEDALAELDDVRTVDGDAEVESPMSLRDRIAGAGEGVRERLADDLETWDDPVAAAEDVELPEPDELDLEDEDLEGTVELPEELESALGDRLPTDRSALAALLATSDPDDVEDDLRERIASDLADDRPEGLSDEGLARLAALEADELMLDRLEQAGFPLTELDAEDREQLERSERLEAVGDVEATDGETLVGHVEVLREEVPEDLAGVVDDDGLLVAVSTTAGQDGAARVTEQVSDLAAPVVAAGGEVTVASEPIVNQEIIDELSAAQLIAIAISLSAATVLLVVATWFSARAVGLGLIGIVPSVVALVLVLGAMRGLGLAFNALTATVASIAVGIGVPYGIHLINRFREAMGSGRDPDRAIGDALGNTGPALVGSAVTTGLAFAVLMLSTSTPLRQFGIVSTLMIGLALLGCLLVQPALLVLWGRRRMISGGRRDRGSRRGRSSVDEVAEPVEVP
jgi:predicted RND superfamily exporter protein